MSFGEKVSDLQAADLRNAFKAIHKGIPKPLGIPALRTAMAATQRFSSSL